MGILDFIPRDEYDRWQEEERRKKEQRKRQQQEYQQTWQQVAQQQYAPPVMPQPSYGADNLEGGYSGLPTIGLGEQQPPQQQYLGYGNAQQAGGMQPTPTPEYQPVQQQPLPGPIPPAWDAPYPELQPPPPPPMEQFGYERYRQPDAEVEMEQQRQQGPFLPPSPQPAMPPTWDAPYPSLQPPPEQPYLGYAGAQAAGRVKPAPLPEYEPLQQKPRPPEAQSPLGPVGQQALERVVEGMDWYEKDIGAPAGEAQYGPSLRGETFIPGSGTQLPSIWESYIRSIAKYGPMARERGLGETLQAMTEAEAATPEQFPGQKGIARLLTPPELAMNLATEPAVIARGVAKAGQLATRGAQAAREAAPVIGRVLRAGAEAVADVPMGKKSVLYEGQRLFTPPEVGGAIAGAVFAPEGETPEETLRNKAMGMIGGGLGARAITRGVKALPRVGLSVEDVGRAADDLPLPATEAANAVPTPPTTRIDIPGRPDVAEALRGRLADTEAKRIAALDAARKAHQEVEVELARGNIDPERLAQVQRDALLRNLETAQNTVPTPPLAREAAEAVPLTLAAEPPRTPSTFDQLNERYMAVQDRLAAIEEEISAADAKAAMFREGEAIIRPDHQSPNRAERIVAGWTDDQIRAFAEQESRNPGLDDWFDALDSKAVDEFNKNKGLYASRYTQAAEAKASLSVLANEEQRLALEAADIELRMKRTLRQDRTRQTVQALSKEDVAAKEPPLVPEATGIGPPQGPRPPIESDWTPSGKQPGGPGKMQPYTPPDPYEQLQDALRPDVEPLGERAQQGLNAFMRAMYDRIYDLGGLEQATNIPVHKLGQVVSGAVAAGEDRVRRLVLPVTDQLGKDVKHLEEYMVLMRNSDVLALNPQAQLPGNIPGAGGNKIAKDRLKAKIGPERFAAVEQAATELWDINNEYILRALVNEGMMTEDAYRAIHAAHPHYIDFHRSDFSVTDNVANAMTRPEGNVSSLNIKKMLRGGSTRKLDQPLARTEAQIIQTRVLISRNRAAKSIVEALEESEKAIPEANRLVRRLTPSEVAEHSNLTDTISFFENGEKVIVQVPKQYAAIAKGLEGETANTWQKVLGLFTAPLRHGAVTYNPIFVAVNPLRDAVGAFYREGLMPMSPEYMRGWVAAITRNSDFSDAAEAGALLSGIVDTMRTTEVLSRAKQVGSIKVDSWQDALFLVPRLIERANVISEQATRIATYHKLRGQGINELDAAIRARDVSVDFAKSGNAMKVINQILPFSNAGVQGAANTVRLIKDNPKQALIASSFLAMPSVMSYLWNQRYETANLVPDYEYANNWIFIIGEGQQNPDPRYPDAAPEKFPIYVKVPKGPTGSFVTAPIELALRLAWAKDDRSIAEHFLEGARTAFSALSPIETNVSGILPPLASTLVGLGTGVDAFRGDRIIPRREDLRPPELQYGPETSKVAVALGERFSVSPRMIEWAIKDYTAGVGQQTLWMSDLALGALGYEPEPPGAGKLRELTGDERMAKLPGVSRFIGIRNTAEERRGYEVLDTALLEARRQLLKVPELNRLGVNMGEPPRDIRIGRGADERVVELTPDQRKAFITLTTDAIETGVNALVQQKYYKAELDKEKTKLVASVTGKLRDIAREGLKAEIEGSGKGVTASQLRLAATEYVQALGEYRDYEALTQKYLGLSKETLHQASTFERRMSEERAKTPGLMKGSKVPYMVAAKIDPAGAKAYEKRQLVEGSTLGKMYTDARQRFKQQHPVMRKYFSDVVEVPLKEAS